MNKPAYFPSDSSEAARAKSESQRSFESKPQDPKWKHFVHVPDPIFSLPLSLLLSPFFLPGQSQVRSTEIRNTRTVYADFRIFGKIRFDPSCFRFRLPRIRISWIYVHFDSLVALSVVGVNQASS